MYETLDVSIIPKSKFYVYTLLSIKDKKLYNGYTTNLNRRLLEHQKGLVESTKNRRPLILVHAELFINKQDAKAREVFLKSGFGRLQLKKAIQHTLQKYD